MQSTPPDESSPESAPDAIEALRALHDKGFEGREIRDGRRLAGLRYRHDWGGGTDVVLVRAEDDAHAYRADDSLGQVEPTRPHREVSGTVVEVVAAVLSWPDPSQAHHAQIDHAQADTAADPSAGAADGPGTAAHTAT